MMPDVIQGMEDLCNDIMRNIHTSMPGKILSYNEDGTVDVKPSGVYHTGQSVIEYPIISGCPVFVSGNSLAEIATPILPGDFCLLLFSEQSFAAWLKDTVIQSDERYSLSNAVALCGLRRVSSIAQQEANKTGLIVIRNQGVSMRIGAGKVTIDGDLNVSGNIVAANL